MNIFGFSEIHPFHVAVINIFRIFPSTILVPFSGIWNQLSVTRVSQNMWWWCLMLLVKGSKLYALFEVSNSWPTPAGFSMFPASQHNQKKFIKGSLVVKYRKKIWPWMVTVSRSNKPTPTFQEKSDIYIRRSVTDLNSFPKVPLPQHK